MFEKLRAIFSEPDLTPFEGTNLTEDFEEKAPIPLVRLRHSARIEAKPDRFPRDDATEGRPRRRERDRGLGSNPVTPEDFKRFGNDRRVS